MLKKVEISHQTPKEIAKKMDEYIIGQDDAKKSVAIAFVNRGRRMMIKDEVLRGEICPKNVLLSGPTGVGKTEIARRVADITDSPFMKVEMTKFTEVGYAGKDVESIIRDLVALTIKRERDKMNKSHQEQAKKDAIDYVAKAMEKFGIKDVDKKKLANGDYDNQEIQIEMPEGIKVSSKEDDMEREMPFGSGVSAMISVIPLFEIGGSKKKKEKELKTMKVRDALEAYANNEVLEYVDKNLIIADVLKKIEQKGVIFLDEIDKLISNKENQSRGEVSREGVQRDLLPIIEGTLVQTKYGAVRTDHILFIAAGAFHDNKISDLMPELQGRFPVQVSLKSLTAKEFEKILTDVRYNLLEQQKTLMEVDGITIEFQPDGIKAIAELAYKMNSELENTGARRLYSVMESVMEEASFTGKKGSKFVIDKKYVEKATENIFAKKVNVRKYTI